ncbi:MAG: S8 family serine peptidase [Pikeienuella sp.]|uniref:S8 family serine peptidase n=1 Tax=Pikeienuella sp. TaxID=2831957 RepID=UPI00391A735F
MTEQIELRFGDTPVGLRKSEAMVGLRPRPGADEAFGNAMAFEAANGRVRREGAIAGFEIMRLTGGEADAWLDRRRAEPYIALGTHVWHIGDDPTPLTPTGEIYLRFVAGLPDAEKSDLIAEHGLGLVESRGADVFIVTVTSRSRNPVAASGNLNADARVSTAEPDMGTPIRPLDGAGDSVDDLAPLQWHLRNLGRHGGTGVGYIAGADARIVDAWALLPEPGHRDIRIAIIDDGFDLSHPDLDGQADATFDAMTGGSIDRPRAGAAHGTAVAGVALARRRGGRVVGAAPASRLIAIAWGGELSDAEFERWFGFALRSDASIISNSWGAYARLFPLSTRKKNMIERAAREGRGGKGCIILFAAGNDGSDVNDPAGGSLNGFAIHPDVIAVAATTSQDRRASYSNHGEEIWISAPSSGDGGWGIVTTDATGWELTPSGTLRPAGYARGAYTVQRDDRFGGTSSACPLAAGVCALILAANPTLTAAEVRRILAETARRLPDQASSPDRYFGWGCVNAYEAVRAAQAAPGAVSPLIDEGPAPRDPRLT